MTNKPTQPCTKDYRCQWSELPNDPTPVSSLPLSGYIEEIKRLSQDRDELLRVLLAVEEHTIEYAGVSGNMKLHKLIEPVLLRIEGARRDEG